MADDREDRVVPQSNGAVVGSSALRPVFLGNLKPEYSPSKVEQIFTTPIVPPDSKTAFKPILIDRVDIKRGFCFVFLKDAASQEEKELIEAFVAAIDGMYVKSSCQGRGFPVIPFRLPNSVPLSILHVGK